MASRLARYSGRLRPSEATSCRTIEAKPKRTTKAISAVTDPATGLPTPNRRSKRTADASRNAKRTARANGTRNVASEIKYRDDHSRGENGQHTRDAGCDVRLDTRLKFRLTGTASSSSLLSMPGARAPRSSHHRARTRAASVNIGEGYRAVGKGLLLWLLGIPIPVIILLYLFHVV